MKQEYQHRDELADLAPFLASLPRTLPFRVPEGYFDQLPATLEAAIGVPGTLPAAATATPGFTVPEGYFDSLPLQIQDRISAGRRTSRPLMLRPAFALSLAAALAAVFLLTRPALWPGAQQPAGHDPALTASELGQSGYLNTFDENTLIELLETHDAPVAASTDPDADMKDYLLENHVDISLLTNQLSAI
jgi:hypothetical protein